MSRPQAGTPPVSRSVAVRPEGEPRKDVANYLEIVKAFEREDRRADLRAMLGSDDLVDRFLAVAFNAIATNSDLLLNAEPMSIIQAVRDSATLGLEPTGLTGEGVIIRYDRTAKFMPMYRGYLKRIMNTGKVTFITAQVVFANDEFRYWYDTKGWHHEHTPIIPTTPTGLDTDGNAMRGDYLGAYAFASYPNGYVEGRFLPTVDINFIRDNYSQSIRGARASESPWVKAWPEMAKKTVIRQMAKLLPQSASDELAAVVNQLLAADAAADAARDAAKEGGALLDTSRARTAALAAVAGRGGVTVLPPPPADAQQPQGEGETEAQTETETTGETAVETDTQTGEPSDLPLFDEATHQDAEGNPAAPGHRETITAREIPGEKSNSGPVDPREPPLFDEPLR